MLDVVAAKVLEIPGRDAMDTTGNTIQENNFHNGIKCVIVRFMLLYHDFMRRIHCAISLNNNLDRRAKVLKATLIMNNL